jgi:hypothetical protein
MDKILSAGSYGCKTIDFIEKDDTRLCLLSLKKEKLFLGIKDEMPLSSNPGVTRGHELCAKQKRKSFDSCSEYFFFKK